MDIVRRELLEYKKAREEVMSGRGKKREEEGEQEVWEGRRKLTLIFHVIWMPSNSECSYLLI